MTASRFYPELGPVSVGFIAELVRGEVVRGAPHDEAASISTPEAAAAGALCFVSHKRAAMQVDDAAGIICLVRPDLEAYLPQSITVISVPDPKLAFGLVVRAMEEASQGGGAARQGGDAASQGESTSQGGQSEARQGLVRQGGANDAPSIHASAVIASTARLGGGCHIAPHVVIEDNAIIGAECRLAPGVVIGQGCILGDGVVVDANATIYFSEIGSQTEIGAGVALGHIGFAVGRDEGNFIIPHRGGVRIGSHVHIGATSCIDRGFIEDTIIGDRVMIDNKCQIGHHVMIGEGSVLCAQTGIAGSVKIGKNNLFGAQCGVSDHVTIGDGNIFAARSGVTKDVGNGQVMGGFPAVPIEQFRRQMAHLRRLGRK